MSDQSKKVYDRLIHLERDAGTTLNGDSCSIPTNARSLESVIPKDSLRSHTEWKWNEKKQTGETVTVRKDLLEHAQKSISKGRFHAVTSGYRQRRNEALASNAGHGGSLCEPAPCCDWGQPGSPAPPLSGASKRRY